MIKVPIRFYLDQKENGIQVDCISLKGISFFLPGKTRQDREVFDKMCSEVQTVVSSFTSKEARVPWIDYRGPDFVPLSDYPMDGGNQTVWIELPLEHGNWPADFTLVQCIACEKELSAEFHRNNPPEMIYGGIYCSSIGNFGSREYDMSPGELVFYLCDDCLVKKGQLVRHVCWAPKDHPPVAEKTQTFTEYQNDRNEP